MTKDEALKLALEALEEYVNVVVSVNDPNEWTPKVADAGKPARKAITAIKEALAQPEQTNTRAYYTTDELNAWANEIDKSNKSKGTSMSIEMKKVWFDGEKVVTQNIPESDIYKRHWDIASCKAYAEQLRDKNRANTAEHAAEAIEYLLTLTQPKQEPVAHSVIAGVLFDFMGWLTSRKERIVLSSVDEASPAVEAITEFAKMRGLSLNDAKVQDWNTTPPQRTWVGLTDEELTEIRLKTFDSVATNHEVYRVIEAKLKEKNT